MYQKPLIGALSADSENCGCCFYVNNSGQGFYVYNGDGPREGAKSLASVGDNSIAVTPLCGTGLPATQPITFGVPIGVTGVHANVPNGGAPPAASIDTGTLGVSVLGQHVGLGLPAALPLPHL